MQQWDILVNGTNHQIILEGFNLSGKAKLRIDDRLFIYPPVAVKNIGHFFLFEIENSEILLKYGLNNASAELIQDGIYLQTGQPLETEVVSAFRSLVKPQKKVIQIDKIGMKSFFSFVLFTYINLALVIINSPFSFPFSAVVPQYIIGIALYANELSPSAPILIIGILIALLFSSIYLGLYFLAKKRFWAIIVALVLISLDTLVVLYFALDDFTYYIIDIAFHAWIIWDFVKLISERRKTENREMSY